MASPLLMETTKPVLLMNQGREPAAKGPMKAVVAAGMHYIQAGDGSESLFKLDTDVEESVNLAREPGTVPVLWEFRNLLRLMLQNQSLSR